MKILFCGAYGYGNIGDELYKSIFTKYLPNTECLFESPYPDMDAIEETDMVVVGGGGLIYNNDSHHMLYMSMYLDKAMELSIPVAFISCGVQTKHSPTSKDVIEELEPWRKYLDYSKCITVRSKSCQGILSSVTSAVVQYAPDLGYLVEDCGYKIIPGSGYDVFVPQEYLPEEWTRIIANNDVKSYVIPMSPFDDIARIGLRNHLTNIDNLYDRRQVSPQEFASVVKNARRIYTSRYHGAVIAYAMGVEKDNIHRLTTRYKLAVEDFPPEKEDAIWHIQVLNNLIDAI